MTDHPTRPDVLPDEPTYIDHSGDLLDCLKRNHDSVQAGRMQKGDTLYSRCINAITKLQADGTDLRLRPDQGQRRACRAGGAARRSPAGAGGGGA